MILYLSCFQNFLTLASCSVYQRLKSLFLAPLMSLEILLFSCEVLSLRYRSIGGSRGDHTISVCLQSCSYRSTPHSASLTWVDLASSVWQSSSPSVNSFRLLYWYVGSFLNWINILHSRTDYFLCGLAVAIWEQIQFSSADEESNICSRFPAAFLLQTKHLDAQFEFLPKK